MTCPDLDTDNRKSRQEDHEIKGMRAKFWDIKFWDRNIQGRAVVWFKKPAKEHSGRLRRKAASANPATAESNAKAAAKTRGEYAPKKAPFHPTIAHMDVKKPPQKIARGNPGQKLIEKSGEQAFYVRTVPGMSTKTVLKHAARTKASARVHETVGAAPNSAAHSTGATKDLHTSVRAYTAQLLSGPLDKLLRVLCEDVQVGLHVSPLPPDSFMHLFLLVSWFLQHQRYAQEATGRKSAKPTGDRSGDGGFSVCGKTPTLLSWKLTHTVHRVWLDLVDTDGKQKSLADWRLQEACMKALRELIVFSDIAFHCGGERDRGLAETLQTRLLEDDSRESGILNRVLHCMQQFKKHDKAVPQQKGRESRGYAVDLVKTLHVVMRLYERLCKSGFRVTGTSSNGGTCDAVDASDGSEDDGEAKENVPAQNVPAAEASKDVVNSPNSLEDELSQDANDADEDPSAAEKAGKQESNLETNMDRNAQGLRAAVHAGDSARRGAEGKVVEFSQVVKMTGHSEVLKLHLFLLERYRTLDAPTLHAITTYLRRLCHKLRLQPMLYQISYMRQFHILLSDDDLSRRSSFKELLQLAKEIVSKLLKQLDPKPVKFEPPGAADEALSPDRELILAAFPKGQQQDALQRVQDRLTSMLFVELLFSKGSREVDMINNEYYWLRAVQARAEDFDVFTARRTAGRDGALSSDDEDAVPAAGRARTEGEKAAARRAQLLSRYPGLSEAVLEWFRETFETMNGRKTVIMMLEEELKARHGVHLATRDVRRVMAALGLKQGELTPTQVEQLKSLADEFGTGGSAARRRIANALPGGFSVHAIKKHLSALGLGAQVENNGGEDSDSDVLPPAAEPRNVLEDSDVEDMEIVAGDTKHLEDSSASELEDDGAGAGSPEASPGSVATGAKRANEAQVTSPPAKAQRTSHADE